MTYPFSGTWEGEHNLPVWRKNFIFEPKSICYESI